MSQNIKEKPCVDMEIIKNNQVDDSIDTPITAIESPQRQTEKQL